MVSINYIATFCYLIRKSFEYLCLFIKNIFGFSMKEVIFLANIALEFNYGQW